MQVSRKTLLVLGLCVIGANTWAENYFTAAEAPQNAAQNDTQSVELGMRFQVTQTGVIRAVRFYKGTGNGGTHIANLWTNGALLARATFQNETASGWQTVNFATPVSVTPGATYVVSYFAPQGRYATTRSYFSANTTRGSIRALGANNGVYRYSSSTVYPTSSYSATNYWVDVDFEATAVVPVQVTVSPSTISLTNSQATQFNAAVTGTTNTAVTWSISPAVGSISATGVYTAPSNVTSQQTITVRATSVADTSKSGTATINLTATQPILVTINPATASLSAGQTTQFAATVSNTPNTSVTWSLSPAVGTISASGFYTAPLSITAGQQIAVVATSAADPNKNGFAVITLLPSVSVSVNPANVSLAPAQSQQFSASLSGTSNTAVTWSLSPAIGSVTSSGLYTAPASNPVQQTISLRATSVADSSKFAVATITLLTSAPGACCSFFTAQDVPELTSAADATAVELGVKFRVTTAGSVSAIKFFKGGLNTGVHSGSLWSQGGQLLSRVTFTNETASGWQTAVLSPAVAVQPGQTYVASYFAPNGGYAVSRDYFRSDVTRGSITMLGSGGSGGNGVYLYGSSGFPVNTYGDSNYFVDVVFEAGSNPSPVQITMTPQSATLSNGQQNQFIGTVTGTANTATVWSLSPVVGTINPSGFYTAPSSITSAQTITVTVTSVADPSKFATGTVNLIPSTPPPPAVSVTINPGSSTLTSSQSAQFTATVTGATNTNVNWNISPAVGTISASGLYTAPGSIASATAVTVRATSVADSSKSATATVNLQPSSPSGPLSVSPASISLAPNTDQVFSFVSTAANVESFEFVIQDAARTSPDYNSSCSMQLLSIGSALFYSDSAVQDASTPMWVGQPWAGSRQNSQCVVDGVGSTFASSGNTRTFGMKVQFKSAWTGKALKVFMRSRDLSYRYGTWTQAGSITVTGGTNPPPATVNISLNPGSVSLQQGQTQQFTPTVTGSSNTAVTYSLTPQTGSISAGGLYSAPASVTTQTTVTLRATSVADSTKSATATITLNPAAPPPAPVTISLNPGSASLSASQTQQFAATVGGTSNTSVTYSLTPQLGSITAAGLYTAPATISAQSTVTVRATSVADATKSATATVTLNAPAPPPSSTITLPIEVMGPNGTTGAVTVNLTGTIPASGNVLWIQSHGIRYDNQTSVQVNNSAWISLTNSSVSFEGNGGSYGGFGGGFSSLKFTVPIPAGALVSGTNTVRFRFNNTDGRSSGFRILAFNLRSGSGANYIAQTTFANDEPSNWQAPRPSAADIAEGQRLWNQANLTSPLSGNLNAKCGSCHARDGRDLKYFNYSNLAIRSRAVFHGLSAVQGDQIASYIRTLNVPSPGRPWNPPYQPGPGLDSQPVANWAAGAGLNAVLDNDPQMFTYLAPGGSTANWAPTGDVNAREIPVSIQLPDWNGWLPVIHPMDAFGDFNGSPTAQGYDLIRNDLRPSDPNAYRNVTGRYRIWHGDVFYYRVDKINAANSAGWTETRRQQLYGLLQWKVVKEWEIAQDFGLEAMNREVFGAAGEPRGWFGGTPFMVSPNMLQTGAGPGIGNGSRTAHDYLSYAWYHTQLILNNGNKQHSGTDPIDWPYVHGFVKNLTAVSNQPHPGIMMLWLIKGLQVLENGKGPEYGNAGWNHQVNAFNLLAHSDYQSMWDALSTSQRTSYHNAYMTYWLNKAQSFSNQQFFSSGLTSSGESVSNNPDGTLGDRMWYTIPILRHQGINSTVIDRMIAWSKSMWPGSNWDSLRSVSCYGSPTSCAN